MELSMYIYKTLTLMAALSLTSSLCVGQIYKTVDADGNVSYSDSPSKNAKVIDIGPINTTPSTSKKQQAEQIVEKTDTNSAKENQSTRYSSLKITSPATAAVIPNGLNGLNVAVSSSPSLANGDQYKLFIDDIPRGLSSSNSFSLDRISRGAHKLEVKIVDSSNKVLKSSASVNIFVRWPQPRR